MPDDPDEASNGPDDRYVFGADEDQPSDFDCSALVAWAIQQVGLT